MKKLMFALMVCYVLFGTVYVFGGQIGREIQTATIDSRSNAHDSDREAVNIVNSSGFDALNAYHSTNNSDMWLATSVVVDDQWVVFDLGGNGTLNEIDIWNYNESGYSSRGVDEMEVLVSADGVNYSSAGVFNLAQGSSDASVDFRETLDVNAPDVQYVKFNINSAHHGDTTGHIGLSEVRFYGAGYPQEVRQVSIEGRSSAVDSSREATSAINSKGFDPYSNTHGSNYNDQWLSESGVTIDGEYIIFDIGSVGTLSKIRVWNSVDHSERGIAEMELLVSDNNSTWENLGTVSIPQSTGSTTVNESYLIDIDPNQARYVKFDINSAHHGDSTGLVGVAEVRFYGDYPEEITTVTVDDYSTANDSGRTPDDTIAPYNAGFNPITHFHSTSNSDIWLSDKGSDVWIADQWVTYDLGGGYDVDSLKFWNDNEGGGRSSRGVYEMDIYVSLTDSTFSDSASYTDLGTFNMKRAPESSDYDFSEIVDLDPNNADNAVRYVHFDIKSAWHALPYNEHIGISEVRFYGDLIDEAPVVDAGVDQTIKLPSIAEPNSTASDDGGPPSVEWTVVSGPGTVTFEPNAFVVDPNLSFSDAGDYVLELEADDGAFVSNDQIKIKVLPEDYNRITDVAAFEVSSRAASHYAKEYMVDGSGTIPGEDYFVAHTTNYKYTGWLSAHEAPSDQYAVFKMDGKYALDYLRIWNWNNEAQRGVNEVEVLVSLDNVNYTSVGTFNIDEAPINESEDYSELIDLGGVDAVYVKLDINSNHGDPDLVGISEIRFSGNLVNQSPQFTLEDNIGIASNILEREIDVNDPEGDPVTYEWTKISGPGNVAFNPGNDVADPNMMFDSEGLYKLQLEVYDPYSSSIDSIYVKVLPDSYSEVTGVTVEDVNSVQPSPGEDNYLAENSINEAGFFDGDGYYGSHSTDAFGNWLSEPGSVSSQYITYDLGAVYSLDYLRIWNLNWVVRPDAGVEAVDISVSTDNNNYSSMGTFFVDKASGDSIVEDYSQLLALGDVEARYVRLDVVSNYGNEYVGISEVKFSGSCLSPQNGDLNNDCKVDVYDLAFLAEEWLNCIDPAKVGNCSRYNFGEFAGFSQDWLEE